MFWIKCLELTNVVLKYTFCLTILLSFASRINQCGIEIYANLSSADLSSGSRINQCGIEISTKRCISETWAVSN